MYLCNVNHGITIASTIGVIKKDSLPAVFPHSMVNADIFCTRNRIGFTKVKKRNSILKGNEEMHSNSPSYVG